MARARSVALLLFCAVACSNARTGYDENCDSNDDSCSKNEHDGETLLQVVSDPELSAKAIEPVAHASLSQHGAEGVIADAITAAKEELQDQIHGEHVLRNQSLLRKKAAEEEKGRKDAQYENDCTWKCSGLGCALKPFQLIGNYLVTDHCTSLDGNRNDLATQIAGFETQISKAEASIANLTTLKTAKFDAATAAEALENSITAKEEELAAAKALLSTEKTKNDNEQRSKQEEHDAVVAFLNAQISQLQANRTSMQAEYDLLTESHTSTDCSQKVSSEVQENICRQCSAAEGKKPCHNECIDTNATCFKDAGCACLNASLLESFEASAKNHKNDPHALNQAIQEAKQSFGEAIKMHNTTIHSLAAQIELKDRAIAEQEASKKVAIAEFDAQIKSEQEAKAELNSKKTAAEARMAESQKGLDDALAAGEAEVAKLSTELAAELKRLETEASETQENLENQQHNHANEWEILVDKHNIAENAIKATITQLEVDKASLTSALQGIKAQHLPA